MPEQYNPDVHGTYGNYLRSKNIQTRPQGWTHATHDQTAEYVGKDGRRVKDTTDQLGNRVVQHGRDQQSVHLKTPETVRATALPATRRSPDVER